MKERPHFIDGKEVFVHRQTPKSKWQIQESYQFQHLRLSNVPQTLSELDIKDHFQDYGDIESVWHSAEHDESWFIKYEE